MPKPADSVAESCARRARYLGHYTRRVERRCRTAADKNQVFAGAFVSFQAFFERELERLFIGILAGELQHQRADVKPLVTFESVSIADAVIRGGARYVDWLPFEAFTTKRAGVFFEGGRPFSELDRPTRQILLRCGVIRNALAHQSSHSLSRFKDEFIAGNALPYSQRSPAGYLRGFQDMNRTRLEHLLTQQVSLMWQLAS